MTLENIIKKGMKEERTTLTVSVGTKIKKDFSKLLKEVFPEESVSHVMQTFMVEGINEMNNKKKDKDGNVHVPWD